MDPEEEELYGSDDMELEEPKALASWETIPPIATDTLNEQALEMLQNFNFIMPNSPACHLE